MVFVPPIQPVVAPVEQADPRLAGPHDLTRELMHILQLG